jgi:hypothetical protein
MVDRIRVCEACVYESHHIACRKSVGGTIKRDHDHPVRTNTSELIGGLSTVDMQACNHTIMHV